MSRVVRVGLLAGVSVILWVVALQLIFVVNVGSEGIVSPPGLLACVLLIAAPAATFIPLGRWARAPLYDIEGTVSWATLGYILAFVQPSDPPSLAQFLLILLPLTVAVASVAACVFYLLGLHCYRGDPRRYDFVRARRQGYLAAFSLIAMMLLYSVGTLSPTSALLLVVIMTLTEVLILTQGRVRPPVR